MPVSAFNDFFFFKRRPSLVRLDLRNDLSRELPLDVLALLNPLRNLMAELLIFVLGPMDDWPISMDDVDADDLRRKLLAIGFFGAFGNLNGLNVVDDCGSNWYEQHGTSGSNGELAVGWSINADNSTSDTETAVFGVLFTGTISSDFKFKFVMAFMFNSRPPVTLLSFGSIFSAPPLPPPLPPPPTLPPPTTVNFLLTTTFCRLVGIGAVVDVDAITSHKTLPFFRPNDTLADFSFLP